MLILTLPLHEKGLHQESFFRYQTHTLMQKAALGQLFRVIGQKVLLLMPMELVKY